MGMNYCKKILFKSVFPIVFIKIIGLKSHSLLFCKYGYVSFNMKKWNNNNLGVKSSSKSLLSLWKSSRVETLTRTKVACVQKLKIINGFRYHSYLPFHDLIYRYYYFEWYEFLIPSITSLTNWIPGIIWISRTNKSKVEPKVTPIEIWESSRVYFCIVFQCIIL